MSLAHTPCTTHRPARTSLLTVLATWAKLRRQRRHLKTLTPAQLCDIGISRSQATTEANRPVWDVPSHWRA